MKNFLLSRYIRSLKLQTKMCSICGTTLNRCFIIYKSEKLDKKMMKNINRIITLQEWNEFKKSIEITCRFCMEISTSKQKKHFDTLSFKLKLIKKGELNESSINEYVRRINRLETLIENTQNLERKCNITEEDITDLFSHKITESMIKNYQLALNKYITTMNN